MERLEAEETGEREVKQTESVECHAEFQFNLLILITVLPLTVLYTDAQAGLSLVHTRPGSPLIGPD